MYPFYSTPKKLIYITLIAIKTIFTRVKLPVPK